MVWAGPKFEAMLEPVVETRFEARFVPWFAGGYHGTLWDLPGIFLGFTRFWTRGLGSTMPFFAAC